MPVMDGLEATKLIRRAGFITPIIALTANAMNYHQALCRDAGMNLFLAKPFTRVDVLRAIGATTKPLANVPASQRIVDLSCVRDPPQPTQPTSHASASAAAPQPSISTTPITAPATSSTTLTPSGAPLPVRHQS
jgi:DNA-binding response OmpR family regulator